MNDLTEREQELVILGAAIAGNCVPCVEKHIPKAKAAGLTERQILAAVRLADQARQVPARTVLEAALALLPEGGVNDSCASRGPRAAGCC